jgi:Cu/Ag efflux protein CusF
MKTKTVQITDFADIDSLKAGDKIKLFCDSSVDEMTRFLKLKTGDANEFIDYIYFAMQHHNHTVISKFLINAGGAD